MALVHYVRSFAKGALPAEDPAAMEEFSKQLAQAPTKIPNRIPVSLAIRKLAAEAPNPPRLGLPPADATEPGAKALREAVRDPVRAARSLQGSPGWRDSDDALARAVTMDLPANGFSTRALSFAPAEWRALRGELITKFGEER